MKKFELTDKGFKIIKFDVRDFAKIGSPGVCDYCNNGMFEGVYIGVLGNRCYCNDCFEKWHKTAKNYPEDKPYEDRVTDRMLNQLNS